MQETTQIGSVPWTYADMKQAIPEFLEIHAQKPISENTGGMKAPHLFATWFMLRQLNPQVVIESGVFKGLGTWLIEQAVPDARLYCIDVNLKSREYISPKAVYYNKDFDLVHWVDIYDKSQALIFFDDHQNAVERIHTAKRLGFKHLIFEDNYPAQSGDCYSLKKAFQHAGFRMPAHNNPLLVLGKSLMGHPLPQKVAPNTEDAAFLRDTLEVYYEFPPVFKPARTRWGDDWTEANYPTPKPLYEQAEHDHLQLFLKEAMDYTWICYARLK
ncbi:MAG: hypothetical protein EP344_02795 [Bacteroidetes bacterium]|nr:MAG: hypothetical protein EP344_02795 [Bacteroidota bacterium]